jgi:3-oxoacyl-[acyl-carrier-protein] synthase III
MTLQNATFRHQNSALLAVKAHLAPLVVTSEEIDARLAGALTRLRLPTGLLQRVAGVISRRNWDDSGEGLTFDGAAALAAKDALAEANVDPKDVGLLINTSVTRKHLEPSVAVGIHHALGLPSSAMNFDITNACLGFVNGMTLASQMIDSGQIKYAVIVDGEDSNEIQANTINRLSQPGISRKDFVNEFASLTLGSGAAAAVLGPADAHPEGHRIVGGISRAGTEHHLLCVGDKDGMFTHTKELLAGGMALVVEAWKEAKGSWDWQKMDRYILHQVSDVHTDSIVKAAKLDRKKIPLTYPIFGNVGPASLPMTLALEVEKLVKGQRVLCMGVGSGINTAMTEILW